MTWNQDLKYDVYYKTNKSEDYILFKEDLSTMEDYELDFTTVELAEDEYIVETMFDFGKVEKGFRESTSPTMKCIPSNFGRQRRMNSAHRRVRRNYLFRPPKGVLK